MFYYHFRPDINDIVILLTDGVTTESDMVAFKRVLTQVKSTADIIVVSIGDVDSAEVNRIASQPSFVHQVSDFDSLNSVVGDIFTGTSCGEVTPPPQPTANSEYYNYISFPITHTQHLRLPCTLSALSAVLPTHWYLKLSTYSSNCKM